MTAGSALSKVDRARLAALDQRLADLRVPAHADDVMVQLAELLGSRFAARFAIEHTDEHVALREIGAAGAEVPRRYLAELSARVAAGEIDFLFSARMPEREQRNRDIVIDGARKALRLRRDEAARLGLSSASQRALLPGLERLISLHERHHIADHYQHRTLICDGALVLCYFNSVQDSAFSTRQRAIYRRAIELVRRRALLDHRLASATHAHATLDAALDALGRAAFVTDARGRVLHANALGIEALDADATLQARLREALRGPGDGFEVTRIAARGCQPGYLIMRAHATLLDIAAVIASDLALAPQARAVLCAAASGEPTKAIAARLDLATNTVEYHLTRIYRRLGIGSRLELHQLLVSRCLQVIDK